MWFIIVIVMQVRPLVKISLQRSSPICLLGYAGRIGEKQKVLDTAFRLSQSICLVNIGVIENRMDFVH
jgi:hypothetical protein